VSFFADRIAEGGFFPRVSFLGQNTEAAASNGSRPRVLVSVTRYLAGAT